MNDTENKPSCFVIQTFDGSTFDRRYNETIKPALIKAEVQPVRSDDILGPRPIIEKIESAIREANICLAEISLDNPNVWLEVGYAYSLKKPTLLLCDKNLRTDLPFDIRHRPVIFYTTDYRSGFDDLEKKIIKEMGEFVRQSKIGTSQEIRIPDVNLTTIDALGIESQLLLYLLMDTQILDPEGMSGWQIKNAWQESSIPMEKISFAMAVLSTKGFMKEGIAQDFNGNEYKIYTLTPQAMAWVTIHPELYDSVGAIRKANTRTQVKNESPVSKLLDDEIPF